MCSKDQLVRPHTKKGLYKDEKRMSDWKPMGSRQTGRPRNRWPGYVCEGDECK